MHFGPNLWPWNICSYSKTNDRLNLTENRSFCGQSVRKISRIYHKKPIRIDFLLMWHIAFCAVLIQRLIWTLGLIVCYWKYLNLFNIGVILNVVTVKISSTERYNLQLDRTQSLLSFVNWIVRYYRLYTRTRGGCTRGGIRSRRK